MMVVDSMPIFDDGFSWFLGRYRVRLLLRAAGRSGEILRYALVRPRKLHNFYIVSTQRNGGSDVLRCLDSVYQQRYPRDRYQHLVIDDFSDDGTPDLIEAWLASHPGHGVDFVHRGDRCGGTWNTLDGIRRADPESIVIELNGDDWLPDPGVVPFLNKVYQDSKVWMTYNTQRESTGVIPFQLPPSR